MQKKITYLIIQYPYERIEIGLYQNDVCIAQTQEHKFKASMLLIPMIDQLLQNNSISLANLDYIGINIGPGPYNTLRAIIATANAIAFAAKIPLVGCNALALLTDFYKQKDFQTVALLQAFSGHIYFRHNVMQGYSTIQELSTHLNTHEKYYFVGNGALQHTQELKTLFPHALFSPEVSFPELSYCAQQSFQFFTEQKTESELHPLYLHQSLH